MKKLSSTRRLKRTLAIVIALVMLIPLVPLTFAAADKLDTPVLIQKSTPQAPSKEADGTPRNPYQHNQYRSLIFEPVEGATGYNVYAYRTKADAIADTNRVAVAKDVDSTIGSQSGGGTMGDSAVRLEGDEKLIDVRLIQFEDIEPGATRDLPEGYEPAGLGDAYFPGAGQGDTTNLKPGQYWFRLQATDKDDPSRDSDLCEIYEDEEPFSLAWGPDEARDKLEEMLAVAKPGDTAEDDFRIVDLRGPREFSDEGYIRFSEGNRYTVDLFSTTEKAEALFGHTDDKSAVTIFVYCRGGGRSLIASLHLVRAGYTNVINMQGVNEWSKGLMYDDPTFRFRKVNKANWVNDGEFAPAGDANQETVSEGISFDAVNGALYWFNIPRAKFNVYAFESATETDPAKAAATCTLDRLAQLLEGTVSGASWRQVRKFDLKDLDLKDGTYYLRVQAVPGAEEPVRGYTPETLWGTPSKLSDAVEIAFPFVAAQPVAPPAAEVTAEEASEDDAAAAVEAVEILAKLAAASYGAEISLIGVPVTVVSDTDVPTVTTITMPESVDVMEITTMAVLGEDGELTPIPTRVKDDGTVVVLLTGSATLVALNVVSPDFSDIKAIAEAYPHVAAEIEEAVALMIVQGFPGGVFKPSDPITAQQAVTMFLRACGVAVDWDTAIETAAEHGYIAGNTDLNTDMTRIATAVVIANALSDVGFNFALNNEEVAGLLAEFPDLTGLNALTGEAMAVCIKLGIFSGASDGNMNPGGVVTRSQMASLAVRLQLVILGL